MSQREIDKGNKLIAEFMGCKEVSYPSSIRSPFHGRSVWWSPTSSDGKTRSFYCYVGKELYRESWELLIPCCKRWDNIQDIFQTGYAAKYSELSDLLDHYVTLYEIEGVWEQLVKNITWYNKIEKL